MEYVCQFYELSLKHQNINVIYDMSNYIREHLSELSEGNHLVQLSLKAFCEIIKSDEVNVETEDVIFYTAMSLIEKEQSDEDITKCLKLIRYEHLTPKYLENALRQPIMKKEPQKSYLKRAHKYQSNKKRMQPEQTARLWRRFVYIDKNKWLCEFTGGERKPLIKIPNWVDIDTSHHRRRLSGHHPIHIEPGGRGGGNLGSEYRPCIVRAILLGEGKNRGLSRLNFF